MRFASFRSLLLVTVLLSLAALAGCGGGSEGVQYSGKVTFEGKPIPLGKIYFSPDGAKGNTGQSGYADIKDGYYNTNSTGGMGTLGGPTIVRIEGQDGVFIDEERPAGKALFGYYEVAVDLPKESATKDFDVPSSAKNATGPSAAQTVVP